MRKLRRIIIGLDLLSAVSQQDFRAASAPVHVPAGARAVPARASRDRGGASRAVRVRARRLAALVPPPRRAIPRLGSGDRGRVAQAAAAAPSARHHVGPGDGPAASRSGGRGDAPRKAAGGPMRAGRCRDCPGRKPARTRQPERQAKGLVQIALTSARSHPRAPPRPVSATGGMAPELYANSLGGATSRATTNN